ncbi:MAG: twin-arginine translocation signal domain-containing protein [Chromatiales bacterium]|nr:twin-arginine translocation signal domain-containing protein [Gammaproteobacteria bacterium]MCP5351589.1 twin-arginine translocation signal domain-containing protein [Chromatiales bacterium]
MDNGNRRKFLKTGGAAIAAGVLGGVAAKANAGSHDGHAGHAMAGAPGVAAVIVSADTDGVCATCVFWGGQRRVMDVGKNVHCESLGWCNNANSHHFQTMTGPQTGPMKSWQKWDAI